MANPATTHTNAAHRRGSFLRIEAPTAYPPRTNSNPEMSVDDSMTAPYPSSKSHPNAFANSIAVFSRSPARTVQKDDERDAFLDRPRKFVVDDE